MLSGLGSTPWPACLGQQPIDKARLSAAANRSTPTRNSLPRTQHQHNTAWKHCCRAASQRKARGVSAGSAETEDELEPAMDPSETSLWDFYTEVVRPPPPILKEGSRPTIRLPRGTACAVVLGGAAADSSRLYPLTQNRTLPAVPFASNYRLIDIVLSNLVNSNIRRIYVLTQFNSTSLNSYLTRAYDMGSGVHLGGEGFVEVVAAAQGPSEKRFAESSVDVVRQWMDQFASNSKNKFVEDAFVLPSDQVFQMDYTQLLDFHKDNDADVTIVCKSVSEKDAREQGVVKLGGGARIQSFVEKPSLEQLEEMSMSVQEMVEYHNECKLEDDVPFEAKKDSKARFLLGSCGMYIFRMDALQRLLASAPSHNPDFGRDLIPLAVNAGLNVMAFNHAGFWADIGGSLESFYDFSIKLARDEVPFRLQQPLDSPFYHSPTCLPPTGSSSARLANAVIGSGCILGQCTIRDSVLGQRAVVGDGCTVESSIIMGSSFYEGEKQRIRAQLGPDYPAMGIGAGSTIRRAILDKNVRVGKNVQLINKDGLRESVGQLPHGICVRDGILVAPKNVVIPDGTVI